jgi:predicted O-methyltransferase YrrM
MNLTQKSKLETIISELYRDAKNDYLRMIKKAAKSIFQPMQPADFKDLYLAISKEQGSGLVNLIKGNNIKNIVEFGTSFGISTLFLAQGAMETGGHIITTELIESKAQTAIQNFKNAGVNDLIEVKIGNALDTLKNHNSPIDLLLLDGWKDLYLPLFQMLESNYHANTIIYVDNADMAESQAFLKVVSQNSKYQLQYKYSGKVVIIRLK